VVVYFVLVCIEVYADDIILLTPYVVALQRLVSLYEENLLSRELTINIKKSICTRLARFNAPCTNIVTSDGSDLQWVDSIRYRGVFIIRSRIFKCCLQRAMQSFPAHSVRFMVK